MRNGIVAVLSILCLSLIVLSAILGSLAFKNTQANSTKAFRDCPIPRSVDVVSAIDLGFTWDKQKAALGGNLDPEAVGKDLPKQFVTEEGRQFALCLFGDRYPNATQQELQCYALFLASAQNPDGLSAFKKECFSIPKVSHNGKLENIVRNMVESATEDQVTLKLSRGLETFWVRRDVEAAGFGQLLQKICTLPESGCLECQQEGITTAISLKPGANLVSAGEGFPPDAKFCAP